MFTSKNHHWVKNLQHFLLLMISLNVKSLTQKTSFLSSLTEYIFYFSIFPLYQPHHIPTLADYAPVKQIKEIHGCLMETLIKLIKRCIWVVNALCKMVIMPNHIAKYTILIVSVSFHNNGIMKTMNLLSFRF